MLAKNLAQRALDLRRQAIVIGGRHTALQGSGPGWPDPLQGLDMAPRDLEDISKVPTITRRLVERGHSDEVILKTLGGNFMRVFEQVRTHEPS